MRTAKTVSITLPPDLLVKAQEIAEREEWNAMLKRARAKGNALGITSDAEVERLSDEYRRSKRA